MESKLTDRCASVASMEPAVNRLSISIARNAPARSFLAPSSMLTSLQIFAIFAAALFSSTVAWGQTTDRYAKAANQLKQLINAGDYAGIQTHFNKQMDAALPLEKSREFFKGLTQQLGQLQKLGEPQSTGGWTVFPAQFEKGLLDLRIALDGRGQIAGLTFKPHVAMKPEQVQTQQPDSY